MQKRAHERDEDLKSSSGLEKFTSGDFQVRRKANQSSGVWGGCLFLKFARNTVEYKSVGRQILFSSSRSLEFSSPVTRQTRRHGRTIDGMDVVVVKAGIWGRNSRQLGTQLKPGRDPPRLLMLMLIKLYLVQSLSECCAESSSTVPRIKVPGTFLFSGPIFLITPL